MTNHLAHSLSNRLYIDLPFAIFPIIAHYGKNKPWIQSCCLQLTKEHIPVSTTAVLIVLMGSTDYHQLEKKKEISVLETIAVVVVILSYSGFPSTQKHSPSFRGQPSVLPSAKRCAHALENK